MKATRTATTLQFECRVCRRRFAPASYRASCSRCGGRLRVAAGARG